MFILASGAQEILHTFQGVGINLQGLIAQIVVFTLLALALKKYAFDPILEVLEQRRARIAESLEQAEKIKKELAQAEASRKEIMQKAQDEANRMIAEAQKIAAAQGEKKVQEAVAEAENLIKKAKEAIALERDKMMVDLRKEVVQLVIETTGKVSGRVLTSEDQTRLKDETVRQLNA